MQKDLILAAYDHYDYKTLAPFVNSIKESGFTGDVVLVCFNSSFETVEKLIEKDVKIVACEKNEHGYIHKSTMPIHTERFFHFFTILRNNATNYRYVLTLDAKDIIFQLNPSRWLEENIDSFTTGSQRIVASSESICYKDEPWGNDNLNKCFGTYIHSHFKHNEIYNVGVIAGEATAMRDVCLNIFLMSLNRPIPIVDQAVWNCMLGSFPYQNNTYFTDPGDAWAVNLGTVMDPSKIEEFRPHLTDTEPQILWLHERSQDGTTKEFEPFVVNDNREPFVIVHQWDRVPELNEYYRKKYDY